MDDNIIREAIERGWENFLARPSGSLSLRFYLQPAIGLIAAIRAGFRDVREGHSAFLWRALKNPSERRVVLHEGWKDVRITCLISATLDIIYQLITHRFIYPLELLFTVTLLGLLPYFVLRGPTNRIIRLFVRKKIKEDRKD
jgi:hypothetical protein